jgi:type VI secretion system protein ImpG
MFPKYYQQELSSLRELGAEFSKAHPSLAPLLNGTRADPDVERLLEGSAFLTALLRQKLDDEFPEIIHDLMQTVAPAYLNPLPSATIQAFRPKATVRNSVKLPSGIFCASVPVEGISCLFKTCYDTEIHPLSITDASYVHAPGRPPMVRIAFELTGISLAD